MGFRPFTVKATSYGKGLAAASLLTVVAACGGAEGDAAGSFYGEHDLEIIVPYSTGGGTDIIGRYIAPLITENAEGGPDVSILNIDGGGSIIGANQFVQRAQDGETALLTGISTAAAFLAGQEEVEFDLSRMQPIVGFPSSLVLYSRTDSGVTTLEELAEVDEPLTMSGKAPQAADALMLLAFEVLGIADSVRPIFGYASGGDQRLAFEQGETQLDYQGSQSYLSGSKPLIDDGTGSVIMSLGIVNADGEIERDPAVPDAMTIVEAHQELNGSDPSGPAWEALKTLMTVATPFAFGLFLPEEAPEEAVTALREAMVSMTEAANFAEDSETALGPYEPFVGDAVVQFEESLSNLSQDDLTWYRQWLTNVWDVQGLDVG